MEIKEKPCKGTGAAKGYGCGIKTKHRVYGLGKMCGCYSDWLLNSENGKIKLQKSIIKATKPRIDLEAAKTERDNRKSISNLLINLRCLIHSYIRERDKGKNCISCNTPHDASFQAGHFYKSELFSTLRFDERNINGQCQKCNIYNSGNESGYRVGIINRFGKQRLDELDAMAELEKQKTHKWERDELLKIREIYKQKIKLL